MRGFSLLQAVVLIAILVVGVALLLPLLSKARINFRSDQNLTQLRGIQQGIIIFSRGSKSGGGDGRY
ncbi:unnamed protein product, partial [Ectocarpus fasciculatus]